MPNEFNSQENSNKPPLPDGLDLDYSPVGRFKIQQEFNPFDVKEPSPSNEFSLPLEIKAKLEQHISAKVELLDNKIQEFFVLKDRLDYLEAKKMTQGQEYTDLTKKIQLLSNEIIALKEELEREGFGVIEQIKDLEKWHEIYTQILYQAKPNIPIIFSDDKKPLAN